MNDLVERQAVLDAIHLFFTEEIDKIPTKKTEDGEVYVIHKCQPLFEMNKVLCKRIKELPSVPAERTGHCKDCKYFEYDSVAKVDGIPLIVAHEICSKWGDGCKTREDGYCFCLSKGVMPIDMVRPVPTVRVLRPCRRDSFSKLGE